MGTRSEQAQGGIAIAAMIGAIAYPAAAPAIFFIAFVLSGVASIALAEDPEEPRLDEQVRGLRANTRSTQAPLRIVYGKQKVGGNDVYIAASGASNRRLWIVQTLSEGPCEGVDIVTDEDDNEMLQYYLNDKLYTEYGTTCNVVMHWGIGDQEVDPDLNAVNNNEWTDPLHHTCYVVWSLIYDKDYYQRVPSRTVVLKGMKVFDFRDDSIGYSNNGVLCLFDYMTNSRYGMGLDRSYFDIDSWSSAATYFDSKEWEFNMVIDGSEPAMDIVDRILLHFRGTIIWYDNKLYLRIADVNEELSQMTLTDAHVFQDASGKAIISIAQPTQFKRPDALRVNYIDPDQNYVLDSLIVGETSGVLQTMSLLGCTSRKQAADIGVYRLERAQLDRVVSGIFRDDALQLESHDLITLTVTALSISGQLMRVREANIRSDGMIDLVLAFEAASLYDDDYNLLLDNVYSCTLPNPLEPPPSVTATISEETYYYRLRTVTKLKIDITVPLYYPWFDFVEVWWSDDDTNWRHLFNSTSDFVIDPVKEDQFGTTQYVRLKTVSIWGAKTSNANDCKLKFQVMGDTAAPQSPAYLAASVSGRSVKLYSARLSDPDIEVYEFKRGDTWLTGILLASYRSPNLFLNDLTPGLHTFWMNTLGTNNLPGNNPQSVSVVISDFGDTVLVATKVDDYSAGSHTNTERVAYNGEPYLQRAAASSTLVGTYLGPTTPFDLGVGAETETYIVAFSADNDITGVGDTWADKFAVATTWANVDAENLSWAEIFDLPYGPNYTVTLKWGNTLGNLSNSADRLHIETPWCTGRYYQVEIAITDPVTEVHTLIENYTLEFRQVIIGDAVVDGATTRNVVDGGTF